MHENDTYKRKRQEVYDQIGNIKSKNKGTKISKKVAEYLNSSIDQKVLDEKEEEKRALA